MTRDEMLAEYRATGMSDAYLQAMAVAYALGAKHEREACAGLCDAYADRIEQMRDAEYQAELAGRQAGAMRCATAIRARGDT